MQTTTIATCALDQWALDLDGNTKRIVAAIKAAKTKGAKLCITPELSIPSYGLLDHFFELDNYELYFEALAAILSDSECNGIVYDVGMPVYFNSKHYNCRIFCYDGRILFIRPKMNLANDGNFREARYFTAWSRRRQWDYFPLPASISSLSAHQSSVRFGDLVMQTQDDPPITIGVEMCEEMFTIGSPSEDLAAAGVDIICNSSGSHHELRKLDRRVNLIRGTSEKTKTTYMYSNLQGCDGDRLYYDGSAMIFSQGQMLAQGSQFSLKDVEVITATVDLAASRSARFAPSWRTEAEGRPNFDRVEIPIKLAHSLEDCLRTGLAPSPVRPIHYFEPEEEIALGPAAWLWDYLRRSKQSGYFLCLSGGIDSCATSVIVFSMCRMVFQHIKDGNEQVLQDLHQIVGEAEGSKWQPSSAQEVCSRILHTAYMATSNSGSETRDRAKTLSEAIGSYHLNFNFDPVISAFTTVVKNLFGLTLRYNTQGGTNAESLALQNIQARTRMCLAYLLAAILCQVRHQRGERSRPGSLLVLGSANVDEALRGYFTKYDASSADLNPIGSISKNDLRKFISWAQKNFELPQLQEFIEATPSAELIPNATGTAAGIQSDEEEMGLSYNELSVFGQLRKNERLGPWGQWQRLMGLWAGQMAPRQIYEKVRRFNFYYSINRHKMTILTPSYHAESYSPDDNRFDLRPFLLPPFSWAYRKIESCISMLESDKDRSS